MNSSHTAVHLLLSSLFSLLPPLLPAQELAQPTQPTQPTQASQASREKALLISGCKVLSPDGTRFLEGRDVLVEGRHISEVAEAGKIQIPEGCQRLAKEGAYLIPGLIDLHSHLLLHPYDETSWNDQVLKESLELRTIRATVAARQTLEAGFTTLRDLGTEGAAFADVALRDAIAEGIILGPRIFCATRALVATGCYGPSGFDPRFKMPKGAQVADGPDGVRKAVREQIAAGADWIKVYADYRRQKNRHSTPTYSKGELEAIVDEARSAGLPVAAHAVTDEAIRRAVLAGVQTIEHGSFAGDETLALMRSKGVVLCPTLGASEAMARYAGWNGKRPEPLRIKASRVVFLRALKSGVRIACGSDVGVFAHGENAREIELMVKYGMPSAKALQAATLVAAKVLGRERQLGRIFPGYVGDLVLLGGDPLENPAHLRRPLLVIKEGKLVPAPQKKTGN